MDRQNIEFLIEMLGKLDDIQQKTGADTQARREEMAAWKEKIEAKTEAIKARTRATRENMGTSHKETAAVIEPENEVETMACQGMEARQEEKPTSADRKPKAAKQRKAPAEKATVMPVREPKKKRRKDRKLAAEHRRQKPNTSTRENCGPQNRLAVARSGSNRRGRVKRHTKETDRKMPRRATVARRKRDIVKSYLPQEKCYPRRELVTSRTTTTRHATVARHKENSVGQKRTKDKVMLRTSKGWALGRDNGRNHYVTRGKRIETYKKMTGHGTAKRITEPPVPSQNIENWILWRGRPLQNEKRKSTRIGGTGGRNTGLPSYNE
jgi:hypothetical protein